MCGICGFTGKRQDKKEVIENMKQVMVHRGPDSEGSYLDHKIALGFRRLSIIDLEEGTQPMSSASGKQHIVFNGEIYNYQSLRMELEAEGVAFHTHSDTETLVNGMMQHGTAFLSKLRGMFAFAFWNEETQELTLARDYFGIKPLYYTQINGTLIFASEIKCILQYPDYKKQINTKALEQYLSFQYSAMEETFFKGIYKLPPGCWLTYKDGTYSIQRYFHADLDPKESMAAEETQKELEDLLKMSVQRHMVSDVEVGTFLSGGIDSGYIAVASGAHRAFTVGFSEDAGRYDESDRAKRVVEKVGLEHHIRMISKQEFWDSLPEIMYHLDEPSGDSSAVALYFLAEEASKYVKVVLSGEGADELFGGYNIYREPEALRWVSWIPFPLRKLISQIASHFPDIKGRDYLIRAGKKVEERFIGNAHIFKDYEKKSLLRNPSNQYSSMQYLQKAYKKMKHLKDAEKMQSIDLNYWLPGDILQKADKMSMAHSLEVRVPFLDKDIFDFARILPLDAKLAEGTTKYCFRKSISHMLPEETARRKKLGFPIPIRVWMRDEDWYLRIKEYFTSETAKEYFHTDYLLNLLEEHRTEKKDNSRKIWTVLAFLIWYKRFFATAE